MRRESGSLSDPKARAVQINHDRYIESTNDNDLETLALNPAFLRWLGRVEKRCGLTDVIKTTNGGDLQHFEGRRSVAFEIFEEFEQVDRGFHVRVLQLRENLRREAEARAAEAARNLSQDNEDEG